MTLPLQPPDETQAQTRLRLSFDLFDRTLPAPASCTITVDTNANMTDGNTVTIDDGDRKVVYEYDKSANGVAAGNVSWAAGAGTAAQSAATLKTAINGQHTGLTVTDNLDGTLTLTNKWPGAASNAAGNAKSSASALAITAWAGGADEVHGTAATKTLPLMTLKQGTRFDAIEILNATGFVGDASNYWTLAFKIGARTVASWSTQTAAQGTITGGTAAAMIMSGTDANLVGAAGEALTLVLTKTGTPSAFPPGRIVAHGRQVTL